LLRKFHSIKNPKIIYVKKLKKNKYLKVLLVRLEVLFIILEVVPYIMDDREVVLLKILVVFSDLNPSITF
jgi:hypothetical protein